MESPAVGARWQYDPPACLEEVPQRFVRSRRAGDTDLKKEECEERYHRRPSPEDARMAFIGAGRRCAAIKATRRFSEGTRILRFSGAI
jgi:hypothetical protein